MAPTAVRTADAESLSAAPRVVAPTDRGSVRSRSSRWPARLDVLQSVSGLFLAVFLIAHMFFVSSILISKDAFYTVARFFEGAWLLGRPQPWLVSCVVGFVLLVFVGHAWLALRKFPANFRQYRAFAAHRAGLRHDDTGLWWIQLWTGFALFFLGTVHLYGMLTQPELIGPYESADRIWTGTLWPLYLLLLFAVEIHGSIGLYRLAVKWGWLEGRDAAVSRRRLRVAKTVFSAFFLILGLITLRAYVQIGVTHADRAGERYVPGAHATLVPNPSALAAAPNPPSME
ncbi:MAG TPA: fumarate reductase cytochrome b subunit [Zoogloea sp.]|uniref:fumarate reductase cytochrome b subunit n=1 Tax=Zoogloea sp. TaxID=49181 RepID=UPI002BDB9472|nr:fumarate reductase cytochrome b subunit [Zoogloea sp.]HNI46854.1 fumarate reductase cytochrome b subunit [Zoogloea sp.]